MRVRNHDGTLCSPEETRTNTQERSSKNVETADRSVDGNKQADSVDTIANSSESQGELDTQLVDESSSKETENSKGRVESSVL